MERVRFGILGCGRISGFHIDAIAQNAAEAQVTAVCDVVEERAVAASGRAGGVTWFTDHRKMLEHGGFDAVSVCTPSGLHPEHGIAAAEAVFHVVSEKPMGISLEAADRLIQACDRADRRLFVVLQNRLNPTVATLRKAVEKGRFGRICFAQVNVFWARPQEYYDDAPWRGTWEFDGGAFLNQAVALRGPDPLARRRGRGGRGAHRDAGPPHRGRGHRRGPPPLPERRARVHQRDHARVPEEPGGFDHAARLARHGPRRRRGPEQRSSTGTSTTTRTTTARSSRPATTRRPSTDTATPGTTGTSSRSSAGRPCPRSTAGRAASRWN